MFHPKVIVRTPSLPFSDDISEQFLKQFLDNHAFAEAIYIASPVLFREAMLWKENKITDTKKLQKIPLSLAKYYSRMCSRCTPFGLFAGCGVAEWADENSLEIASQTQRNTRLDMHYAGALAQRLAEIPSVKMSLKYYPNSSIYRVGDDIRYIEYKYIDGRRTHQITAITWSEYIQLVLDLCVSGSKIETIIPHLTDDEITETDAQSFIEELIESQLLVNELEPAITGEEFTNQVRQPLNPQGNLAQILNKIETLLSCIDQNNTNEIALYEEVIENLKLFEIPFEEGKLFQTDLVKLFNQNKLDKNYQAVLEEIYHLSKNISENPENQKLKDFKKKYFERYETQELPLLFALDTETGIGYGETGKSHNTPLADGLNVPNKSNDTLNFKQSPFQQYLFKLWLEAYKNNAYQVDLEEFELKKFQKQNIKTAPSASITFRLTGDVSLPIYLEAISGSSAANLLGRFAHADKNILEIVNEITAQEQANNPDVVFAEIVHLPENRIGNIMLHPPFRNYEIPYLAKSSLPNENQITLDDLRISIDSKRDKILLRSKKLNKEIIPRLSNAHNFAQNTLPLYNFLCDIQNQNIQQNFNLGWKHIIPNFIFSPRLTYKNVILELASWSFPKENFKTLIDCEADQLISEVNSFRQKWTLPSLFVLADFDNELLVNSGNLLSVQTWVNSIKNRDKIELKEFFFNAENNPVKNAQNQGFTNQFIAAWINDIDKIELSPLPIINQIQRNFSIGSEWLYFKFYTGSKGGDLILTQALNPIIEGRLLKNNLIKKWFFIRYQDPDKHIRFRVQLNDVNNIGLVFQIIKDSIQPLENKGIIWKTQIDTYQREIERYGESVMNLTETLFCEDSQAILFMLTNTFSDEREHIRWQWCLKLIDTFLADFGYSLTDKKQLMEVMKISFADEFKVDKALKMQLDQRFRNNRQKIERILNNNLNETHEYTALFDSITCKSDNTQAIIEEIKSLKDSYELNKYLADMIHMTVNRAISDNQRLHELVMYDFLYRYYQAEIAKVKTK